MNYPKQTFLQAVYLLATRDLPIRERLVGATMLLRKIRHDDILPPDLLRKHRTLLYDLTAGMHGEHEGSIEATVRQMSQEKVTDTIERIVELHTCMVKLNGDIE